MLIFLPKDFETLPAQRGDHLILEHLYSAISVCAFAFVKLRPSHFYTSFCIFNPWIHINNIYVFHEEIRLTIIEVNNDVIEKIGNQNIYVKNYTSNFDIKEYIQNILVPLAFPNIEVNKLNLGLLGITSEMISSVVEDSFSTASLMMNESFINRSQLPSSIYSEASLFNLGMNFATPSRCNVLLQLWMDDILKYSSNVGNTTIKRYKLDKDTKIIINNNIYRLDYDIFIDHQYIDGQLVLDIRYDMDNNPISIVQNPFIKHQITSVGWLLLFLNLQEYNRTVDTHIITDNLITVNSNIELKWRNQIAGIELNYISPYGEKMRMELKPLYSRPSSRPFVWYSFQDDNTILLSFSSHTQYFQPEFNSKIESIIYTCNGASSNFDVYNNKIGLPVQKTGMRYEYNPLTRITALCYSESKHGKDKGDIETLRDDIVHAHNTVNTISTDYDLQSWFERNAKQEGIHSEFFKRRDDLSGRLYSQFITIMKDSEIFPTNTLSIEVSKDQCDYTTENEYMITPGHLWTYKPDSRNTLELIPSLHGYYHITDENIPTDKEFLYTNPFYMKIHKNPSLSVCYNTMIAYTTYPETIYSNNDIFYKFQLATLSIERDLSREYKNQYRFEVVCVPVVSTSLKIKYIEGIGEKYKKEKNYLRLIMVFHSRKYGETGYIEMEPTEIRNATSVVFSSHVSVIDKLSDDYTITIDKKNTPGVKSLIQNGVDKDQIVIDVKETQIDFLVMMKDVTNKSNSIVYNDESFKTYIIANRFTNDRRDLSLYKEMTMMRSMLQFQDDKVHATLIPFIKYDIGMHAEEMGYFVDKFNAQYTAMQPVLRRLDGNTFVDFKLFNTYGKSNNYYIGPKEGTEDLWDSDIRLDNVELQIRLKISVLDRSIYSQTVAGVKNEIKNYINSINQSDDKNLHVSDIIHLIKSNQPNVNYIRFLGFNHYDANKQSIFKKFDSINNPDNLQMYVPEILRIDDKNIIISEEI